MKLEIKKPSGSIYFPLNEHKALSMAKYLLNRLGGKSNYMFILKLIFFADRYHLREYLRPVSTDSYYAMKNGPVASYLYDVVKGKSTNVKDLVKVGKFEIELQSKETVFDELSKSDIEAINFSLSNFASYGEFCLSEITHGYPEWAKYADSFVKRERGREQMFFEDFLENANPNNRFFKKNEFKDPYRLISHSEREMMKKEIREYCAQLI